MDVCWIRQELAKKHLSQADLGEAIGLTSVQINKVLTGYRRLSAEEADAIRRFFGYRLPEEPRRPITVIGRVGAGDHIQLADDYEKGGGLYEIERPAWVPDNGIGAAEVTGASAEPFALDGDVVFWRRHAIAVMPEDLGRPVVAETEDGRVMLKRLASGSRPGLWSLLSINPTHPSLIDIRVLWASRVMAPLPKDQIVEV